MKSYILLLFFAIISQSGIVAARELPELVDEVAPVPEESQSDSEKNVDEKGWTAGQKTALGLGIGAAAAAAVGLGVGGYAYYRRQKIYKQYEECGTTADKVEQAIELCEEMEGVKCKFYADECEVFPVDEEY